MSAIVAAIVSAIVTVLMSALAEAIVSSIVIACKCAGVNGRQQLEKTKGTAVDLIDTAEFMSTTFFSSSHYQIFFFVPFI